MKILLYSGYRCDASRIAAVAAACRAKHQDYDSAGCDEAAVLLEQALQRLRDVGADADEAARTALVDRLREELDPDPEPITWPDRTAPERGWRRLVGQPRHVDRQRTQEVTTMTGPYPEVVRSYFSAFDRCDFQALTECFTDDATVTDGGRSFHGHDEIRAWREQAGIAYEYVVEVLDAVDDGDDTYVVDTNVASTASGDPVELRFRFTLNGRRIKELQIGS